MPRASTLMSTRDRDSSCSSMTTVPVTGPRWTRTCASIRCRTLKPAVAWDVSTSQVVGAGAAIGAGTGRVEAVSLVVCIGKLLLSPHYRHRRHIRQMDGLYSIYSHH